MKASKTFKGTWKGRAGESTEHLATSNKLGARVIVHRWTDTNEVTVRAVTGDAWRHKKPFAEFAKVVLQNPSQMEIDAAVAVCAESLPSIGAAP